MRLVGGRVDPAGAWAYGRLEVFDGTSYTTIRDEVGDIMFGRRAAQVACRTLGFQSGAQMFAGTGSALPGADGVVDIDMAVVCNGDEATLADCAFLTPGFANFVDPGDPVGDSAVSLVCSNASGADDPPMNYCRLLHGANQQ